MSSSKKKWALYSLLIIVGLGINFRQFLHEQYMHLYLYNKPVVVTFSTTPYRIDKMQDIVQTIFSQSYQPDRIYLAVPYVFKRDNIKYEIPDWIIKEKRITVIRSEDYGPATKILGLLAHKEKEKELDPETIIITLDDDIKYHKNALLYLAYQAAKYSDRAIGYAGVNLQYDINGLVSYDVKNGVAPVLESDAFVSILQGFGGVAYRRKFFDDAIFDIVNAPRECINSDDLYLSYHLAKKNIPRQILRNKYANRFMLGIENEIGLNENALHQLIPTPEQKHRTCVQFMRQQDPYVVF